MIDCLLIIQARMGSSRLPEKVLRRINNIPLIQYQIERLKTTKTADKIVLATTNTEKDDALEELCAYLEISIFRGDEQNVLKRFYDCAKLYSAKTIVRVNGDCPLITGEIVDLVVDKFNTLLPDYDYVSNILKPSYPIGFHVEVFKYEALEAAYIESTDPIEREHVTPYIYRNPERFKNYNVSLDEDLSCYRLTVDYLCDFQVIKAIIEELYHANPNFSMHDAINFLQKNPKILGLNVNIKKKQIL